MYFEVLQQSDSLKDHYSVTVDNHPAYRITAPFFNFKSKFTILDMQEEVVGTVRKKNSLFSSKCIINLEAFGIANFYTNASIRDGFFLEFQNTKYSIFSHKNRKYSIFENDQQIGMFEKALVSVAGGDQYRGLANNNLNKLLMVSLVLAFDIFNAKSDDGNTIVYDLGIIGPEENPYDESWVPIV